MNRFARATALIMLATPFVPCWASGDGQQGSHEGGPHYTYIEAGISRIDHDGIDGSNGFAVRGGWEFAQNWHVFGGARRHEFDEFDAAGVRIGIGYAAPISDRADLVLRAGYETVRVDLDPHAHGHALEEDKAGSLEIGLRGALSERLEAQIGARHAFFEGGETLALAGVEYRLGEDWALSADIDYNGKGREVFFGIRKYF